MSCWSFSVLNPRTHASSYYDNRLFRDPCNVATMSSLMKEEFTVSCTHETNLANPLANESDRCDNRHRSCYVKLGYELFIPDQDTTTLLGK